MKYTYTPSLSHFYLFTFGWFSEIKNAYAVVRGYRDEVAIIDHEITGDDVPQLKSQHPPLDAGFVCVQLIPHAHTGRLDMKKKRTGGGGKGECSGPRDWMLIIPLAKRLQGRGWYIVPLLSWLRSSPIHPLQRERGRDEREQDMDYFSYVPVGRHSELINTGRHPIAIFSYLIVGGRKSRLALRTIPVYNLLSLSIV